MPFGSVDCISLRPEKFNAGTGTSVQLKKMKIHKQESLSFFCPGCKMGHTVNKSWGYNDNPESPTFSAHSIKVDFRPNGPLCHSFITDGMIKFESDSTHELSGQTVELPHFPENYGTN